MLSHVCKTFKIPCNEIPFKFINSMLIHVGIGQSVLAGTRLESCRAGEWVRKASDDVIGNRYGYLHVIYQSLSNLYLISI